jgi:hypothetical protein
MPHGESRPGPSKAPAKAGFSLEGELQRLKAMLLDADADIARGRELVDRIDRGLAHRKL